MKVRYVPLKKNRYFGGILEIALTEGDCVGKDYPGPTTDLVTESGLILARIPLARIPKSSHGKDQSKKPGQASRSTRRK